MFQLWRDLKIICNETFIVYYLLNIYYIWTGIEVEWQIGWVETLKTEYKDLDKRLGYFESLIDSDEENKGGGKRKRRSRKRRF